MPMICPRCVGPVAAYVLNDQVVLWDVLANRTHRVPGMKGGVPELAGLEDDDRCRLHVADVADVLLGRVGPAGEWDVVLLDVDNGPDFLIRPANAELYAAPLLVAALARVARGGALVVWSSHVAPELHRTMGEVAASAGGTAFERVIEVSREGRTFDYALYGIRR